MGLIDVSVVTIVALVLTYASARNGIWAGRDGRMGPGMLIPRMWLLYVLVEAGLSIGGVVHGFEALIGAIPI